MKRFILFIIMPALISLAQAQTNYLYRYWLDGQSQQAAEVSISGEQWQTQLDVSSLSEGLHTFYLAVQDTAGRFTPPVTRYFLKMPQTIDGAVKVYCYIDNEFFQLEERQLSAGILSFDMNVSSVSEGFHTMLLQVLTADNTYIGSHSSLFYRAPLPEEYTDAKLHYLIDGVSYPAANGVLDNGSYHLDLDLAVIPDGLHRITGFMASGNKIYGGSFSSMFYKIPVGGSLLTQYEYWLNEGDSAKHTVTLAEPKHDFELITLLPVESLPIRSSCFQFAFAEDSSPIIYAKNDLHMRFGDNNYMYRAFTAQYVDENVVDTIVADTIGYNQRKTISIPGTNTIHWFKLAAEVGDSMAFKTNIAGSIQLFAPSGKEVYAANGSKSVTYDGCHAWESGTYYLAIHDVTGKGSNITVEYQHIDKYAMLEYSPYEIGNKAGNRFKMHLFGNGYDKLQMVLLTNGNDTIYMDTIEKVKRVSADVFMIIPHDSVSNGWYDLSLVYNDKETLDTLTINQVVELVSPIYGEIGVSVNAPSTLARPYSLTVTLENKGNMDYTYIPFNMAFEHLDPIQSIMFKNFGVAVPLNMDTAGYQFAIITDNLFSKGREACVMFLFVPYLGAQETRDFQLEISVPEDFPHSGSYFDLYAWTGDAIEKDSILGPLLAPSRIPAERPSILSWGDNMQEVTGQRGLPSPVQAAGQNANMGIKIGATLAGIQNGLGYEAMKRKCEAAGIRPDDPLTKDLYEDLMGMYPCPATVGDIIGGDAGEAVDVLMGVQRGCAEGTDPTPAPHRVAMYFPADPNDIFGSLSEAGSHFISQNVDEVFYEIEFENDTAIATAAAHTIVIRDTLDTTLFDPASFAATGVTMGDKSMTLDGEQQFTKTMDLRTRVNVIAQVTLDYNPKNGVAVWTITSLDPMTMDPTEDANIGALPVNYDGSGAGSVSFRIKLRQPLPDGEMIPNRASIIFDYETPIMTPTWVNTIDAVCPHSQITDIENQQDTAILIRMTGTDNRSGIWKYEVYATCDTMPEWTKLGETVADSASIFTEFVIKGYNTSCEYMSLAVDSAGNREMIGRYQILLYCDTAMGTVAGSGVYDAGTTATLSATPADGYKFVQWSDEVQDNPRLVTVDSDIVLYALFEPTITTLLEQTRVQQTAIKVLYEGHLYILRDGRIYTITGQEVK